MPDVVDNSLAPDGPLRVAALVKQVPAADAVELGPDGRLVRSDRPLEMNPYCRRAVSMGVQIARASGGHCTVLTLGPETAEDVLREAVAWGADEGVHLCDPAFGGSDTLATALALEGALRRCAPFDLLLAGRNSIDGETGQVGPELAELLGLPFAAGVRRLRLEGRQVTAQLELDDGRQVVALDLPAVLSVAERLTEPAKVPPAGRAEVPAERLRRLSAADLGQGPWGEAASPTRVGAVRRLGRHRHCRFLAGTVQHQVDDAVAAVEAAAAEPPGATSGAGGEARVRATATPEVVTPAAGGEAARTRAVAVVVEPGRPDTAAELLAAARRLAGPDGEVVAFGPIDHPEAEAARFGEAGATRVWALRGLQRPDDVAGALVRWTERQRPWAVLAPSTAFGREVAGRAAAATRSGLVGDAIGVERTDAGLVAQKPAFTGSTVADISFTSPLCLVSVRPGVLPLPSPEPAGHPGVHPEVTEERLAQSSRVALLAEHRDDDVEVLGRAPVVIGVGTGVHPEEYGGLRDLASSMGAELAATRKVTDNGWMPRSRQVGITGRSISPRLYVVVGASGKFNHMAGVQGAGTVLAVNLDRGAPVFEHADLGVLLDWREFLPPFAAAMGARRAGAGMPANA